MIEGKSIGAIIIGRNEGERLRSCLASLPRSIDKIVYVDSGSTDKSSEVAKAAGAEVIELDLTEPFTAARARNAGFAKLSELCSVDFVQFVDGDCELQENWIDSAFAFMSDTSKVGVSCGRRRERFPEASIYNRLCDWEWNTPIGPAKACGGDALMRSTALEEVGGFNASLIAGEEPELCVRLRAKGWQIWRLDHEMTLHDAAITRFGQWWTRARRAGYAFAEGAAMHGAPPERHWVEESQKIVVWGIVMPISLTAGALLFSSWFLLGFTIYPFQVVRLAHREGCTKEAWEVAFFLVLGKLPQAVGLLQFWYRRLQGNNNNIIEYK